MSFYHSEAACPAACITGSTWSETGKTPCKTCAARDTCAGGVKTACTATKETVCETFAEKINKADCLDAAILEYGNKVLDRKTTLQEKNWNDSPTGCAVKSGGDWSAYFNAKSFSSGPITGDKDLYTKVTHPKQLNARKAAEAAGKVKVTQAGPAGLPSCFAYQKGVRRFCVCSGGSGGRRVLGQAPTASRRRLGGGGGEAKDEAKDEAGRDDIDGVDGLTAAAAAAAEDDLRYAIVGGGHDEGDEWYDDVRTSNSAMNSIVQDTLLHTLPGRPEAHDDDDEGRVGVDRQGKDEEGKEAYDALEKTETATHTPSHPRSSSAAGGPRPSSSPLMLMLVASVAGIRAAGDGATTRTTATSLSLAAFVSTLILAAMPTADAHNWLPTPGRSFGGPSTTKPCKGRKSTDTHQQVGPGQTFNLGFQTGHGSKHYLFVVRGEDEQWLAHPKLLV